MSSIPKLGGLKSYRFPRHRKDGYTNSLTDITDCKDSFARYAVFATFWRGSIKEHYLRFCKRHMLIFNQHGTNDRRSSILIYSERAVRRTEQTLLNLAFCIFVLGPIFMLSFITGKTAKLCLVLGFVLATCVLASVLSDNAQKSSLALVAG
jgi:hypothetical protein